MGAVGVEVMSFLLDHASACWTAAIGILLATADAGNLKMYMDDHSTTCTVAHVETPVDNTACQPVVLCICMMLKSIVVTDIAICPGDMTLCVDWNIVVFNLASVN